MFRVMMVCTGNICRSPMAEIVLRTELERAGLAENFEVVSSGISDEEYGNPIDPRARRVLKAAGYVDHAIETHSAKQLNQEMLRGSDLVLTMTAQHARAARALAVRAGDDVEKIVMFRSFDKDLAAASADMQESVFDVEDPWYGNERDFVACLEQVEGAVQGLIDFLAEQA